jgi:hypothetical protein
MVVKCKRKRSSLREGARKIKRGSKGELNAKLSVPSTSPVKQFLKETSQAKAFQLQAQPRRQAK